MEHQNDVKRAVDQLRANIDHLAFETQNLQNEARLEKLRKMNDLQQIATSLEDIDNSLNDLLEKQALSARPSL